MRPRAFVGGGLLLLVEDKLQGKTPSLPYTSASIKEQNFWRPVFVVEQEVDGHCIVFVPFVPDTSKGSVLLVAGEDVQLVPTLSAIGLNASLKKIGAGLVSDHRIQRHLAF